MAGLEEYRRKRDPAATTEPMPRAFLDEGVGAGGNSFVIQEHHASALHWDFRLERDGVLVSWAVPKGLPTDTTVNRLAVHVEDHPLEYAGYEGTISHGQYGGGDVTIWDTGTYSTEKWSAREVKVVLSGRRVQGRFVLFQTGGKNWMMHRMDGPPRPDWLALPQQLQPMTATSGTMPRGRGWAYELAWPGIRTIGRVEGGRIELTSAQGSDISRFFPELRAMGERLGTTQVLLDGVLVGVTPAGHVGGDGPAARLDLSPARVRTLARTEPVSYFIFDLLHLDGRSLLDAPYRQRRAELADLDLDGPASQVPPAFEGAGPLARQAAREQGLARVIAKRASAPYRPGERSVNWIAIDSH